MGVEGISTIDFLDHTESYNHKRKTFNLDY